jgi:hypothetical protein
MPPEEMMNGYIPLPRKLQPVAGIPPIGIEMAVGETCDLRKGTEEILENYKEDEEERYHKRE